MLSHGKSSRIVRLASYRSFDSLVLTLSVSSSIKIASPPLPTLSYPGDVSGTSAGSRVKQSIFGPESRRREREDVPNKSV